MGYCTWTRNTRTGGAVAAWIGTGTDVGKQVTVRYLKGALGATNKIAACNDVRNQFCKKYAPGGKCFTTTPPPPNTSCSPTIGGTIFGQCWCGDAECLARQTGQKPKPTEEMCAGGTKSQICAKQCQFFDLACLSAKVQCSCGGGGLGADVNCFGTGIPCGLFAIGAGILVLLILLKR